MPHEPDIDFALDQLDDAIVLMKQVSGVMRRAIDHAEDVSRMLGGGRAASSARLAILTKLEAGEMSRTDLLKGVGLNRPSAWTLAMEMEREGLVKMRKQPSVAGRPTTWVAITERGSAEMRAAQRAKSARQDVPTPPDPPRIDVPSPADGEASPALNWTPEVPIPTTRG